jgi:hypothetical protein
MSRKKCQKSEKFFAQNHANFVPKMKKSKIPVSRTPEIVQNLWKS